MPQFFVRFPTIQPPALDWMAKERPNTRVFRAGLRLMTPDYADAVLKLGTIGSFVILTIFGGAAALIVWSLLF